MSAEKSPTKLVPGIGRMPYPAYTGSEPYIFVSYSHQNSDEVFSEIIRLNEMGYHVWYDEGISIGNEWTDEIARALMDCSVFLVFFTPESAVSNNVRDEINLAIDENKQAFAVYLQESRLQAGIRLRFGSKQAILKYTCSEEEYVYKITKALTQFGLKPSKAVNTAVKEDVSEKFPEHNLSDNDPTQHGRERNEGSSAEGKGVNYVKYTFANGNSYEGESRNNNYNGHGVFNWADGTKYDGQWLDGKMHGTGTLTWPNGNSYTGEMKEGKRNGQGKFIFANGNVYEGEFRNGQYNGRGIFTWADGRSYDGQWSDGKMHGMGTMTWPNGTTYTGMWVNNQRADT